MYSRAHLFTGPVTDYGSTMVQWMQHRRPRYRHGARLEAERPTPNYIIDVREILQVSEFGGV